MSDSEDLLEQALASFEPWNRADVDAIVDGGWGSGQGFGFRTRDARVDLSIDEQRRFLSAWFDSLERYRIEDVEIDCRVDGEVAVLWGFFTEDFRHHGGEPERVRVRTSTVLRRRDGEWESVWGHRDIQDFGEDGFYQPRPLA